MGLMDEPVHDSPDPWVAAHIRRFLETGGHPRAGMNDLLLTTRGRRSNKLRRTVLVYARDEGRYVLAATNAGSDRHPAWYLNTVANPHVRVQVGTQTSAATARVTTSDEEARLWELMIAAVPAYRRYRQATERHIPVVVLELSETSSG